MPHTGLPVAVQWEKNGWEPRGFYVVRSAVREPVLCSYTPDGDRYLLGLDDSTAGGRKRYSSETYTREQIRGIILRGLGA